MKSRKLLRRNVVTIERRTPRDMPVERTRNVPVLLSIIVSSACVGCAASDTRQFALPLAGSSSIENLASVVPATLRQRRPLPGFWGLTGVAWPSGAVALAQVRQ